MWLLWERRVHHGSEDETYPPKEEFHEMGSTGKQYYIKELFREIKRINREEGPNLPGHTCYGGRIRCLLLCSEKRGMDCSQPCR